MEISPVSDKTTTGNIWSLQELPEAPPMPKDSIWVKGMEWLYRLCPDVNPEELRQGAFWLMNTTQRMLSHQIAHDAKKNRETAQRWKDAISGR